MERVGSVTSIHRYPVKSMGGERLEESLLTLEGFPGDRRYAFVQADSKSVFPWLTGRELPGMLGYRVRTMPGKPPTVEVESPHGEWLDVTDPALLESLAALSGRRLHMLADHRGNFDVAPVTLISHASVAALANASETANDPLRYRMNLAIETGGDTPFTENEWVGRILRVGEARIAVTEPDKRCAMITLDHPSSTGSAKVLKAAADLNGACAGVYGAVITAGVVREGDELFLE